MKNLKNKLVTYQVGSDMAGQVVITTHFVPNKLDQNNFVKRKKGQSKKLRFKEINSKPFNRKTIPTI